MFEVGGSNFTLFRSTCVYSLIAVVLLAGCLVAGQ